MAVLVFVSGCHQTAPQRSSPLHAVYVAGKQLQAALSSSIQPDTFARYRTQFEAEISMAKDEMQDGPVSAPLICYEMASDAYKLAAQAWDLRERYRYYCSGDYSDGCKKQFGGRARLLQSLIRKDPVLSEACGQRCDVLDSSSIPALLGGAVQVNKFADGALLANGGSR